MNKKKSSQMKKRSKKSLSTTASKKKQSMRDIIVTPTRQQIEASIQQGTTQTLADFRKSARL
jgi:phage baseplate assembly protein W